MYLLDTDHVAIAQREAAPEYPRLLEQLAAHAPEEVFVSIVSFQEIVLGANAYINRAGDTDRLIRGYEMLQKVIADFTMARVIGFDADALAEFAVLRRAKIRIGTMDLRIAAIALAHEMTVVTRNAKDFSKVPELNIEDWTR
jgi:tRNA(fMet)-specific endonuclease VapC